MTLEEMREKKKQFGYSYELIADRANVPLSTVQKIFGGVTKTPRYETMQALERAFSDPYLSGACLEQDMVREASTYGAEKKSGKFTVQDYFALPDDQRVELIDGEFFVMEAPSNLHQVICGELHAIFRDYIRRNKGLCVPMVSPVDVQLDCDNYTMVQPDVLILCDRSKFKYERIFGAPDLVVEILSKTTRKKDLFIKAAKYMNAGVREYWIVDLEQKRVIKYLYGEEDRIEMYTFQDNIPVGIFDNQCVVNFAEIYEYVEFLYHVE